MCILVRVEKQEQHNNILQNTLYKHFSITDEDFCAGHVPMVRFAEDYRVALQQSYTWTTAPDVPDAQGFFARPNRRRHSAKTKTLVHTLSFWCLNPAVVSSREDVLYTVYLGGKVPVTDK